MTGTFRWNPGCKCCEEGGYTECEHCSGTGNNMPRYLTVEISGMANDACLSCAYLDGTYVLEYGGIGSYCNRSWVSAVGSSCGGYEYTVSVHVVFASPNYRLYVYLTDDCTDTALRNTYFWNINLGASKPNCMSFSGATITGGSRSGASTCASDLCDASSATVKVSSGDTT